MSDRKLKAWQDAGLIDGETAARIRAFEEANNRPFGLWAVIGIAALAIGLGVISLVAANWDAIPGLVRLGVHFAVLAGLSGFLAWRGAELDARQPWFHEALLFVAGMIGLSFMGHVGQYYQTSSPLWKPALFWLVLLGPLMFSLGRSWLIALMLMVAICTACWGYGTAAFESVPYDEMRGKYSWQNLVWGLMTALPVLVTAFAAFFRRASTRPDFWRRVQQCGLIYAIGGVSAMLISGSMGPIVGNGHSALAGALLVQSGILAGTALLVWALQKTRTGGGIAACLALGALFQPISMIWPGIGFLAFWAAIAAVAASAGWRGVFQVAVAFVALRLIVLSYEWGGDLLGSGIGLIIAGVLGLGIAWLAVRVSKRFAPPKEVAA